jgi:hypothetical protein
MLRLQKSTNWGFTILQNMTELTNLESALVSVPFGKVKVASGLGAAVISTAKRRGCPVWITFSVPNKSRLIFGLRNRVSARMDFELGEHSESPPFLLKLKQIQT